MIVCSTHDVHKGDTYTIGGECLFCQSGIAIKAMELEVAANNHANRRPKRSHKTGCRCTACSKETKKVWQDFSRLMFLSKEEKDHNYCG